MKIQKQISKFIAVNNNSENFLHCFIGGLLFLVLQLPAYLVGGLFVLLFIFVVCLVRGLLFLSFIFLSRFIRIDWDLQSVFANFLHSVFLLFNLQHSFHLRQPHVLAMAARLPRKRPITLRSACATPTDIWWLDWAATGSPGHSLGRSLSRAGSHVHTAINVAGSYLRARASTAGSVPLCALR